MSVTTIYGFHKDGTAYEAAKIQDFCQGTTPVQSAPEEQHLPPHIPKYAWGTIPVWSTLEKRHLPPYIPSYVKDFNWYHDGMPYENIVLRLGYVPTRLSLTFDGNTPADDICELIDDPSVPRDERIVLMTTFNKVLVKREHFEEIIKAFRSFGGQTSLPKQADILEELLKDNGCIAAGWSQSNGSGSFWNAWNNDGETTTPYNCLTQNEHVWLFDELDIPAFVDAFLFKKWKELEDVPFDDSGSESDMVLAEDWWCFKAGTEREDIWHFFDEHYSKGVAYLLNKEV